MPDPSCEKTMNHTIIYSYSNLACSEIHNLKCVYMQEIMHDPQIAADGFTYEGQAIRDWFIENGQDTSPMTNLKLDNLNLTPNRALHSAIQDWLYQPVTKKY